MARKKDTRKNLLTKVAKGIAFGDTSNSAVRNILTEISKELYGRVTNDQMYYTLDFFEWRCPYTGKDLRPLIEGDLGGYAADHIYPQNRDWCGLNVQGNLVFVDKKANSAKTGLDIETFLLTDTKALTDIDECGRTREQRLEKIREFQADRKYDPELIRDVVRPMMEYRYKQVREEQESWISDVMAKLALAGILPEVEKEADEEIVETSRAASSHKGYTYDEKLEVVCYYLTHDEGLILVEENCMKLVGRHGATAKSILNKMGIKTDGSFKGLLLKSNIDDEIAKAGLPLKKTLEEIKNRGLC